MRLASVPPSPAAASRRQVKVPPATGSAPRAAHKAPRAGLRGRAEIPGREAPAIEADFLRMKERAESMLERDAEDRTGRTLQAFAEGGLAYLAGDDAAAGSALARMQQLGGIPPLLVAAGPLWVIKDRPPGSDLLPWEAAVAYGDGRGSGLAEIEARLASAPTDLRVRFGHAYLSRLHGDHQQAIEDATACHQQTVGVRASPGASFVAAFLAEEHAASWGIGQKPWPGTAPPARPATSWRAGERKRSRAASLERG